MEEQEIVAGNSKIAIFMGATPEQWYPPNKENGSSGIHMSFPRESGALYPDGQRYHPDNCLHYHKQWNWIMPVVEKINTLGYPVTIYAGSVDVMKREPIGNNFQYVEVVEVNLTDTTSMLEMVWTAVVEFIEYLNKQI